MSGFYDRFTPAGTYGQADFVRSAFTADLGSFDAFWESVKGGALSSYGLGTAIRDAAIPAGAPTATERFATPIPDMSGMTEDEQRQAAWSALQDPVQEESPASLEARRTAAGAITEEQYKASPFYREGVPWDASMTTERAAALAAWNDAAVYRETVLANSNTFAVQTIGDIAGQAVDPINYIPVLGPGAKAIAVTRLGFLAGHAAVGAADAALNTAVAALSTREIRRQFGDDVSWRATLLDIGTAALIGGVFGGGAGLLERRARARFEVRAAPEIHAVLNDAVGGIVTRGEVELSPASAAALERMNAEREAIGKAYDQVRAADAGPADDPLVHITPEDIEGTVIARGGHQGRGDATVKGGGWGLVKFIWRHGEESSKPVEMQVSREDLVDFPRIIREYESVKTPDPATGEGRTWAVERPGPNGPRILIYGESFKKIDGADRAVVSVFVRDPRKGGNRVDLSPRRADGGSGSPSEVGSPVRDTAGGVSMSASQGRSAPATADISAAAPTGNAVRTMGAPAPAAASPAIAEAAADVASRTSAAGAPDAARTHAEAGLDGESGDPVELAELEQLGAEGRLTAEDQARFDAATAMVDQAGAYGDALRSVATCLLG